MHYQPNNITGILELDDAWGIIDDNDVGTDNVTSDDSVAPSKMGGNITWSDPIVSVTVTTASGIIQLQRIIEPRERLTYAPAVELRYLGEMAELD